MRRQELHHLLSSFLSHAGAAVSPTSHPETDPKTFCKENTASSTHGLVGILAKNAARKQNTMDDVEEFRRRNG